MFGFQVGLRLVEDLRIKVQDAIKIDPIRPVAQIYEELFSELKNSLEGVPREEFIAMRPPLSSMLASLYRCVSSPCVPVFIVNPNPVTITQVEGILCPDNSGDTGRDKPGYQVFTNSCLALP